MRAARSLSLLAAVVAVLAPEVASAQKKVRVAILEIRALGTEATKAELLSEVALTEAAAMPGFEVIGKSDINSIIGFEKQKRVMGCGDDSSCLAEIGGALGVDFILVGSVGAIDDLFRLDLKLVETKKAKVRARIGVTVEGKERKLVAAIQKAVRDLLGPETPTAAPVARAEPPPRAEPMPVEGRVESQARPAEPRPPEPAKAPARLAAPPPPKATPVTPAPRRPLDAGVSARAGLSRRTWSYLAGGVGVAALAGGAVAGLQARSALDREKKAAAAGDIPTFQSERSKVKSMSNVADALFVGGAAGLGVGTWLFLTSRPGGVAVEVAPLPGGAYAALTGGF